MGGVRGGVGVLGTWYIVHSALHPQTGNGNYLNFLCLCQISPGNLIHEIIIIYLIPFLIPYS